ncbi:MAG: DNA repair protein RecO [Syntrophaceae bacterium]|nr:DNA repair protein RecO [Syntrophaceae bacterium]
MRSIILRRIDRGETDELITFFSRDCGWMTGIAKNSKKSRVRFGGNIEPYTIVDLTLRHRKRDDFVWIDDASVIRSFNRIRLDMGAFAQASYFLELASIFSPESSPDEKLFDFIEDFLTQLNEGKIDKSLVLIKEIEILGLLGYSPTINVCPVCSKIFDTKEGGVFSLEAGGICHLACVGSKFDQQLSLSPETLILLRTAFTMERNLRYRLRLNTKGRMELRKVLSSFVRWLRGADIMSLRFIENLSLAEKIEN